MNKKIKRYNYIDLMKVVGIFFVIVYHSRLYNNDFMIENNIANYIMYFFKAIVSTCVPIFFFVNGYLLFKKEFDLKKHLKKMLKLVLLSFLWELILLISYLYITNQKIYISSSLILSYLSLDINYCLTIFWFIGALICIYLFFPLLKEVYDKNKKIFKYFVVVAFIFTFGVKALQEILNTIGYLTNTSESLKLDYEVFKMYNPFIGTYGYTFVYFCLGGLIHDYENKILDIPKSKRNTISFSIMILSCCALFSIGIYHSNVLDLKTWDIVWNGYDTIFTLFNVIAIFVICLNYNKENKIIMSISKNTLGIFFIHVILIEATKKYIIISNAYIESSYKIVYCICILLICNLICTLLKKISIIKNMM